MHASDPAVYPYIVLLYEIPNHTNHMNNLLSIIIPQLMHKYIP